MRNKSKQLQSAPQEDLSDHTVTTLQKSFSTAAFEACLWTDIVSDSYYDIDEEYHHGDAIPVKVVPNHTRRDVGRHQSRRRIMPREDSASFLLQPSSSAIPRRRAHDSVLESHHRQTSDCNAEQRSRASEAITAKARASRSRIAPPSSRRLSGQSRKGEAGPHKKTETQSSPQRRINHVQVITEKLNEREKSVTSSVTLSAKNSRPFPAKKDRAPDFPWQPCREPDSNSRKFFDSSPVKRNEQSISLNNALPFAPLRDQPSSSSSQRRSHQPARHCDRAAIQTGKQSKMNWIVPPRKDRRASMGTASTEEKLRTGSACLSSPHRPRKSSQPPASSQESFSEIFKATKLHIPPLPLSKSSTRQSPQTSTSTTLYSPVKISDRRRSISAVAVPEKHPQGCVPQNEPAVKRRMSYASLSHPRRPSQTGTSSSTSKTKPSAK